MSSSDLLSVEGLGTAWGGRPVLREVNFAVRPGEFVVLMGPNGSGKTTLLRALAGLEPLTSGTIRLNGRRLDALPTHRRGIGFLFQEPALFPHLNVWQNVAYGLRLARQPADVVERRVAELLRLLHIGHLEGRPSAELSGGERQRVALARTLATSPSLILLDEPFASVDAQFRAELRSEFQSVLRASGTAAIHVTHDREEALFLGTKVMVLLAGRIEQRGTPRSVYEAPASVDVARFLGYNIIPGPQGELAVEAGQLELVPRGSSGLDAAVIGVGYSPHGPTYFLRSSSGEVWQARGGDGAPPSVVGEIVSLRVGRSVPIGRGPSYGGPDSRG